MALTTQPKVRSGIRPLLRVLQVTTTIPYRWSVSRSRFEFSLSMCLCKVLHMMFIIALYFTNMPNMPESLTDNVAGIVFGLAAVIVHFLAYIVSFVAIKSSKQIISLITDILEALERTEDLVKENSYSLFSMLLIVISFMACSSSIVFFHTNASEWHLLSTVLQDIYVCYSFIEIIVIYLLFKSICSEISRLLVSSVNTTTSIVGPFLTNSKIRDDDREVVLTALLRLECQLSEVSICKFILVSYLFIFG